MQVTDLASLLIQVREEAVVKLNREKWAFIIRCSNIYGLCSMINEFSCNEVNGKRIANLIAHSPLAGCFLETVTLETCLPEAL